jgi:hypothetical protein
MKDNEDHAVVVEHKVPLPIWITYSNYKYYLNPKSMDPGVIEGYLTDGVLIGEPFTIKVEVFNEGPMFSEALPAPLNAYLGGTTNFILPQMVDRENQPVTLTVSSMPAPFILFDHATLTFTIQPISKTDVGKFTVSIFLSDGMALPTAFELSILVKDPGAKAVVIDKPKEISKVPKN